MTEGRPFTHRSWPKKFRDAFYGVWLGIHRQSSFRVHFTMAILVVFCAVVFRVSLLEWCILLGCIVGVLMAEMFNSALESLGKAITDQRHGPLGNALDIGSAAVLVASVGAGVIGSIIFLHRLGMLVGWW